MNYQKTFIEFLKSNIPKDISLNEYIEDKLHVSKDGAYRRIGGRTSLTLNEAITLLQDQNLSMAEFMGMSSPDKIIFDQLSTGIGGESAIFPTYAEVLKKTKPSNLAFLTNSVPRNHLFDFPNLSFFQIFFTAKTMVGDTKLKNVKFSFDLPQKSVFLESLEPIVQSLNQLPSTEIFSIDAIDTIIKPILYYSEIRQFEQADIPIDLLEQLSEFIDHLEKMAVTGKKMRYGQDWQETSQNINLYFTEIPLQDTTAILSVEKGVIVIHVLNSMSMVSTTNTHYCNRVKSLLQSILDKSSNLTLGGEKQRIQFFNIQRKKIEAAIRQVRSNIEFLK